MRARQSMAFGCLFGETNMNPANATAHVTPEIKIVAFQGPQSLDNRQLAKALASLGLFIFPCGENKKPKPEIKWRALSTTGPHKLDEWWDRWPDALPAIDLAKSILIVLDGDRHPNKDGVVEYDGVAATERLFIEHGTNPAKIPTVLTPGGGRHYYFMQSDGSEPFGNGRGALPQGVDVRGCGGYVIAPGTRLRDGRGYGQDSTTPNILW